MRECFIPLLHHISIHLKTNPDLVASLCQSLKLCRDKLENKIFLKEFQKISTVTWPQFYRSVLKYSLKTSSTSALNILTEMCQFLMNGDKLPDAETIYEMTTSHSSYLSIMAGRYHGKSCNWYDIWQYCFEYFPNRYLFVFMKNSFYRSRIWNQNFFNGAPPVFVPYQLHIWPDTNFVILLLSYPPSIG